MDMDMEEENIIPSTVIMPATLYDFANVGLAVVGLDVGLEVVGLEVVGLAVGFYDPQCWRLFVSSLAWQ